MAESIDDMPEEDQASAFIIGFFLLGTLAAAIICLFAWIWTSDSRWVRSAALVLGLSFLIRAFLRDHIKKAPSRKP